MTFWTVPAGFVTTQVKVDLKSSDVTVFNSKLLCRIAPSSKVDLKQSLQLSCGLLSGSIIISSCFLTAVCTTTFEETLQLGRYQIAYITVVEYDIMLLREQNS